MPKLDTKNYLQEYIPHYQYDSEENKIELEWQSNCARVTGTVIHQYLQLITQQGLKLWDSDKIEQQRNSIIANLRLQGIAFTDLQSSVDKVSNTLQKVLQSEHALGLLRNDYGFSQCDYPVTLIGNNGPSTLVIDRVFTDNTGLTWIVDYKTAEPQPDDDISAFIEEQKSLYENKMARYKRAIELKGFTKTLTALYFPSTDTLLRL